MTGRRAAGPGSTAYTLTHMYFRGGEGEVTAAAVMCMWQCCMTSPTGLHVGQYRTRHALKQGVCAGPCWYACCRFGHGVSCAMDVFCYLELLGSASRQQLSSALAGRAEQAAADFKQQQQEAGEQQSSSKALLKLLRRHMSARQVRHPFSLHTVSFTPDADWTRLAISCTQGKNITAAFHRRL